MIRDGKGRIRLTKSEINILRKENAKHGVVLGDIKTDEDLLAAAINGLPDEIVNDMIEYFDTGSSPLSRSGSNELREENNNNQSD